MQSEITKMTPSQASHSNPNINGGGEIDSKEAVNRGEVDGNDVSDSEVCDDKNTKMRDGNNHSHGQPQDEGSQSKSQENEENGNQNGKSDHTLPSPPLHNRTLSQDFSTDSWDNGFDIETDQLEQPGHRGQVSSLGFTSSNFTADIIEDIHEYNNGDKRTSSITIDDHDFDQEFPKMRRPSKIHLREVSASSAQTADTTSSNLSNCEVDINDSQHSNPPNFAGGAIRRRGSQERRMQQRAGLGPGSANNNKNKGPGGRFMMERKSSVRKNVAADDESLAMSLASFTSAASMTSQPGGEGVAVGNLVFVTDEEMKNIVYGENGNGEEKIAINKEEEGGDKDDGEEEDDYGYFPTKHLRSFSDHDGSNTSLAASLPPTAVLGQGSFATVRLAWRKSQGNVTPKPMNDLAGIHEDQPTSNEDLEVSDVSLLNDSDVLQASLRKRSEVVVSDGLPGDETEDKGELVAVKIIQKSILKQMKTMHKDSENRLTVSTAFDNIEREIATMKKLRHPNLVRLFEVIDSEESDRLYMVLEYVSLGEILSHVEGTNKYRRTRLRKRVKGLTPDGYFDEKHAALYFVDILHGIGYLHRHHICHRDLKPENILLGANGVAKISDFGVAHMFENERGPAFRASAVSHDDDMNELLSDNDSDDGTEEHDPKTSQRHTHLSREDTDSALIMSAMYDRGLLTKTEGTWCFWSPEMCNSEYKVFSGYAADLWAAGVCLYIFATGKLPFFSNIPSDLFDMIENAELNYEELGLSDSLKELLSMMLVKDPASRAGVGDCLQHDFCKEARDHRIKELGMDFEHSEKEIVLTNDEVHMALSITKGRKSMFDIIKKRFTHKMEAVDENDDSGSDEEKDAKVFSKMIRRLSNEKGSKRETLLNIIPKPMRNSSRRSTQNSANSSERRFGSNARNSKLRGSQTFSTMTDEEEKSPEGLSCSTKNYQHIDSMDSEKVERVKRKKHRVPKLIRVSSDSECLIQ